MLETNAANAAALKREICVLKAKRDVQGAVEKLTAYVGKYQSDRYAWQELAETYAGAGLYHEAIFCYEELVLFEPTATRYLCRIGELHYTAGRDAGLSNAKKLDAFLTARKYFAHCLHLAPDADGASRPGFGLVLATNAVAEYKPDDELNLALAATAAARLKSLYKAKAAPNLVTTAVAPFVANHTASR